MSYANDVMARHAHAKRYSPGDCYDLDGSRYVVRSVAIISEWHVVLRLGDGETIHVLELDPNDQIVCRDTKPVFEAASDPQQSLF
jgi:hypothetical protein